MPASDVTSCKAEVSAETTRVPAAMASKTGSPNPS